MSSPLRSYAESNRMAWHAGFYTGISWGCVIGAGLVGIMARFYK